MLEKKTLKHTFVSSKSFIVDIFGIIRMKIWVWCNSRNGCQESQSCIDSYTRSQIVELFEW